VLGFGGEEVKPGFIQPVFVNMVRVWGCFVNLVASWVMGL
jgi:hypothetical protein